MRDDEFNDLLGEVARRSYNPPPPVPRDAIWAGLEAARARRRVEDEPTGGAEPMQEHLRDPMREPMRDPMREPAQEPIPLPGRQRHARPPLRWWGLGIAATLALGIGIGRVMERQGAQGMEPVPSATAVQRESAAEGSLAAQSAPALDGAEDGSATSPLALPLLADREGVGTGDGTRPGDRNRAGDHTGSGDRTGAGSPGGSGNLTGSGIRTSPDNRTGRGNDTGAAETGSRITPRDVREAMSSTYRLAALEHLVKTEVLLTSFQQDAREGRIDNGLELWARELLSTTRLLLDSPAATEPRLEGLLRDLELVLVQIAQYPESRTAGELELIDQALLDNDVITRLRLAVPSGPLLVRS